MPARRIAQPARMKQVIQVLVVWLAGLKVALCDLNSACTNHHDCNDPARPGSVPFSYCKRTSLNQQGRCVCHPWFVAITGQGTAPDMCRRGSIGMSCLAYGNARDNFCSDGIGRGAFCDVDGKCRCAPEFEELRDKCGKTYCSPIGEGSICLPSKDGDFLCRQALKDPSATCHLTTKVCVCGAGRIYSKLLASCLPLPTAPDRDSLCRACIETGGKCYSTISDRPDTCECPKCKSTSLNKDWRQVGCDQLHADLGDVCSAERGITCRDQHAECSHTGILADLHHCVCCQGWVEVCDTMGDPCVKKCVKEVSRNEDKNCDLCWARGGRCYQDSPDGNIAIGIGCLCPVHLSTSNPMDPNTFCDTSHVNITCTSESMKVCYDPSKHDKFPGVTKELMESQARLYVEHHQEDVQCQFQYDSRLQRWCLDLTLLHHSQQHRCGVAVTHPSRSTISYSSVIVLQRHRYKITVNDFCVCVYCLFDTMAEVYSGLIVGKQVRYSGGVEISPELSMFLQGEHSKLGYMASVSLHENIRLCIEMTDDKNVYEAIQALTCIASTSSSLFNKQDTLSCLLVKNACVTANKYLSPLDNFRPLPTDRKHICTGYFPAFSFTGHQKVYFHCAVRTCRNVDDCKPVNCTSPSTPPVTPARRRRSLDGPHFQHAGVTSSHHTVTSDHHVIRWTRAVEADEFGEALQAFADPDLSHQTVGVRILPDQHAHPDDVPDDVIVGVSSDGRDDVTRKGRDVFRDGERTAYIESENHFHLKGHAHEKVQEAPPAEGLGLLPQTLIIVLSVIGTATLTFTCAACLYFKSYTVSE